MRGYYARFILFLILCFGSLNIFSQEKNAEGLIKKYSEYFFLNPESVYLHLNKTTLVPTEGLWFSAYSYNTKSQTPNPLTTNLNLGIYDTGGRLVEAKTIFMGNGKGVGFLKLDSTKYSPGDYLIRAFTKYMENFREELCFSQKFTILGKEEQTSVPVKYDLQFLPEGGHLVENVQNTVGVKLIDNSGKGVFFTGAKVLNSKGEVINTFKSNKFGISKFNLEPKPGETYTVSLNPESASAGGAGNQEISQKIQIAEPTGIAITTNSSLPQEVVFSVKTNPVTYKAIKGKSFFVGIGQKGRMKALGFIIPESLEAVIKIPKTALFPGINRITIFDENINPLAERLLFNRRGLKRKRINAEYKKRVLDSLVIGLSSPDSLGLHSLSVSVLPKGTRSYEARNNILSAFYIAPYIKGKLEDGSYYFSSETNSRRRDYDLDLLLLTQGWSKYSWENIFNHPPVEYYPHEQGFTLTGKVNGRLGKKEKQLFVKSSGSGFFSIIELDEEGAFELDKLFLREKDTLAFGLINQRKGKVSKPGIYFELSPLKQSENIEKPIYFGQKLAVPTAEEEHKTLPEDFLKDRVSLSKIILEAERDEDENEDFYGGSYFNTKIVDDDLARSFNLITDYIRFHGFIVRRGATGVTIYSRRNVMLKGHASPLIFLNGMQLGDNSQLLYLRTSDVESISINKSGTGYGMRGWGGVIRIKTKITFKTGRPSESASISILENGFAPTKEFYAPKYASYDNSFFTEYGAIDWFPDVVLGKNGKAEIKVWNTLQPELKLFVEGITSEGGLVSEVIEVKVKK